MLIDTSCNYCKWKSYSTNKWQVYCVSIHLPFACWVTTLYTSQPACSYEPAPVLYKLDTVLYKPVTVLYKPVYCGHLFTQALIWLLKRIISRSYREQHSYRLIWRVLSSHILIVDSLRSSQIMWRGSSRIIISCTDWQSTSAQPVPLPRVLVKQGFRVYRKFTN